MQVIEAICLILVTVISLGMFYYLGWLAGRDSAIKQTLLWDMKEDNENDE